MIRRASPFLAACALLIVACQSSPSGSGAAVTSSAAATSSAAVTSTAAATSSAAVSAARDALCARDVECYLELAKKVATERSGDASSVEREAPRLRAHAAKKCGAQTEQATPDAMAACMKLACGELVPCVAKLGRASAASPAP